MTSPDAPVFAVEHSLTERPASKTGGFFALLVFILFAAGALGFFFAVLADAVPAAIGLIVTFVLVMAALVMLTTLVIVGPGNTAVTQFFGNYTGTIREPGFYAVRPLTTTKKVSVKVHNFETNELKVNDFVGNPINIAAIVVWQVADTAKASFGVESYEDFVQTQSESALRHVAMSHPYDNTSVSAGADDDEITLRGDTEQVCAELEAELADRVAIAGLQILEVRISSLAYAPEIAQAMLRRQQASAVIAAREQIVAGAVDMVENALEKIEEGGIVELDQERRAAMVSNLLVVLCSERGTSPVVNTGSLYN